MSDNYTYKEYASSEPLYQRYSRYQQRYAQKMRDSDRILVEMVQEATILLGGGPLAMLDVGCSTGNLLRHLRRALPQLRFTGGDLMAQVVEECRTDPELAGMDFQVMDILDISFQHGADIIVVNAVLYLFDNQLFGQAAYNLNRALRPGGILIVFDFFHPFAQDLTIVERSRSHPQGLSIHMRSQQIAQEILEREGFRECQFRPFKIGVDLPLGQTFGDNDDGFQDLNSYTMTTESGDRLLFRGALHQPWCHLLARKK